VEIRSVVCLEKFEEVRRGVGLLTARDVVGRARATAVRQAPRCAVLTCSDSRVAPELLTLSNLGEMYVVRVAGNVVDGLVLHSLKFAVENLGVRKIYVIGHKRCGAVAAALEGRAPPPPHCTTDKKSRGQSWLRQPRGRGDRKREDNM
jgi:carbonic anhydrase